MATTIKLKNSVTTTNAPSSLAQGEVAINITDKKVWVGNAATTPIQLLGDGGSASFTSIAFGAGTVSNPSITFTGDTNTGIYSPAADTIAFTEGGTESMRIDSSGNVGIGTSSPAARFDITQANPTRGILQRIYNSTAGSSQTGAQVQFTQDSRADWVIGQPAATDAFAIWSGRNPSADGTERMRITASGDVLVNATSNSFYANSPKLTVVGGTSPLVISNGDNSGTFLRFDTGAANGVITLNANARSGNYPPLTFVTSDNERMRIDASGNVGIGGSTPGARLAVFGNFSKNTGNEDTWGLKVSDETAMAAGVGGSIVFVGNYTSGGGKASFGSVAGAKENATSSNGLGQLRFYTTDSSSILQERMRITGAGDVLVGKTTTDFGTAGGRLVSNGSAQLTRSSGECLSINRLTNDGTLVEFAQDGTVEGTISVSGTTVSYNGGHLSRYAQTIGAKDESLVKGTILSNLDEMNEYIDVDGNLVDNEQLNKVKVSDVEGDVNVAGVFVNWSHDEAHNVDEINMAMTGDMIIRIAEGVAVQKGDLLMSAGNGTAKPQGDDIVRSKTIAKVTSTHVTCTYADGSYCVPCVLMAC